VLTLPKIRISREASSGSGFVVLDRTRNRKVLVTNAHVIEDAVFTAALRKGELGNVSPTLAGADFMVEVACPRGKGHVTQAFAVDFRRDLAVLSLPTQLQEIPALPVARELPQVGENVFALGEPLGLRYTLSRGICSAIRRERGGRLVIQTDASISPGNSGGPLLNENAEVVGIVTYTVLPTEGQNLNFAVAIAELGGLSLSGQPADFAAWTQSSTRVREFLLQRDALALQEAVNMQRLTELHRTTTQTERELGIYDGDTAAIPIPSRAYAGAFWAWNPRTDRYELFGAPAKSPIPGARTPASTRVSPGDGGPAKKPLIPGFDHPNVPGFGSPTAPNKPAVPGFGTR
jgi:hypothetical protein